MTVKELYNRLGNIITEGKGNYNCIFMDGNWDVDVQECDVIDDDKEVYLC